jgi:hypothetical protein
MRVEPGRYGWNRVDRVLILNGPGSKSGYVWMHHELPPIWLIFIRIKSRSWLWMSCGVRQGSMRFYAAGWSGSMRFEQIQYGYWYEIEILAKKFEHDPKSFFAVSYSQNPQELTRVPMRVYAGGPGLIRYWNRMDQVRNPAVCDCSIIMPHPLWHGASVFSVSSKGPPHLVTSYNTQWGVEDLF